MASRDVFGPFVVARRQTAEHILTKADILGAFVDAGGLKEDLELIRDTGAAAELANTGQSTAAAGGMAATVEIIGSIDALKDEYGRVMPIVQAVVGDLRRGGAPAPVISGLEKILKNEKPVRLTVGADAASRRARKVQSQEALRAEIAKDGRALLDLKEAHPALARRKVDVKRLEKLVAMADGLAGKIGERTAKKGASKAATEAERKAVKAQKDAWNTCYRLLAVLAEKDARVAQLLAVAAKEAK